MPRPPLTAAEAVRVLETVEALTARVSAAVADCDPLAMSSALRACEAVGVEVEPMATARDVLGLDRAAFLRRELSSVLHTHQLAAAAAASAAAAGAAPAEPAAAPSRAPSQTELRIVHCTLQVRREREREGGRREGVPATPSLPPQRPSRSRTSSLASWQARRTSTRRQRRRATLRPSPPSPRPRSASRTTSLGRAPACRPTRSCRRVRSAMGGKETEGCGHPPALRPRCCRRRASRGRAGRCLRGRSSGRAGSRQLRAPGRLAAPCPRRTPRACAASSTSRASRASSPRT